MQRHGHVQNVDVAMPAAQRVSGGNLLGQRKNIGPFGRRYHDRASIKIGL